MTQMIYVNEALRVLVDYQQQRIFLLNGDNLEIAALTHEELDKFENAYADTRLRLRPLNESDLASMLQSLAGDGLMRLRALANTRDGYTLRLQMKRGGRYWTVRNWGEWHKALEEANLEYQSRL